LADRNRLRMTGIVIAVISIDLKGWRREPAPSDFMVEAPD
jgi:hypothetical protein